MIRLRRPISLALHAVLIAGSVSAAFWLRFDGAVPESYLELAAATLPLLLVVRVLVFIPFRLFDGLWRYTSLWDLRNIVAGTVVSSALFYAILAAIDWSPRYPPSVLVIDAVLLICLVSGVRLARRVYAERGQGERTRRILVFGAGDAGEMIVRDMRSRPEHDAWPIGFIDDDPRKVGRSIHGVPVIGTSADVPRAIAAHRPDELLIAVPSATPDVIRRIVRTLEHAKVRITTLPNLRDLIRPLDVKQIRELRVEDLLSRTPVGLDPTPARRLIACRSVLVTGAGGSIGSEICRQVAALGPRHLVLLDRYENSLVGVLNGLQDEHPQLDVHAVIADITDQHRVEQVLAEHGPEIVFHAAAHKHVPLMEANPCEAVKNNVRGSRVVADACTRHGVSRFVLISTDKAVNPTSVMGATKRVAELVIRDLAARGRTEFITVRFGNVLGSNGSVVPRFLDQIRRGGPVTVTDPEMRRYFMLIPEAVQLVLGAAALPEHGGTYVLDMGEPVKLLDMARDLIRLSGYIPDEDIAITFIGRRPGEKLHEHLVGADEAVQRSPVDTILRVVPTVPHPPAGRLLDRVGDLEDAASSGDREAVFRCLNALIPSYSPTIELAGIPVAGR